MANLLKEMATLEERMDNFLNEEKYEWSAYGNGNEIGYEIEGFTYTISVTVFLNGSAFDCETTHKGRLAAADYDSKDEAVGNAKTYKTLKGAMSYIERWTDK